MGRSVERPDHRTCRLLGVRFSGKGQTIDRPSDEGTNIKSSFFLERKSFRGVYIYGIVKVIAGTISKGADYEPNFAWGVKSLPWLILPDRKGIVWAEGFGIKEIGNRINNTGK